MSDRQALLRAVLESPLDDGPRLVFADWLEEHGDDSDRARAECIRVQCALQTAQGEHRENLEIRNYQLVGMGHLPVLMPWHSVQGRQPVAIWDQRGMIGGVLCYWRDWIRWARRTCRLHPITQVKLRRKEPYADLAPPSCGWRWAENQSARVGTADEISLALTPFLDPAARAGLHWFYDTKEEAQADLARAAASWGRSLVGLPPIPITTITTEPVNMDAYEARG